MLPESAYIKPFNLREDYAKVLRHTKILEEAAKDEVKKLKEEVRVLKERKTVLKLKFGN